MSQNLVENLTYTFILIAIMLGFIIKIPQFSNNIIIHVMLHLSLLLSFSLFTLHCWKIEIGEFK